jgi:hypothetical protein
MTASHQIARKYYGPPTGYGILPLYDMAREAEGGFIGNFRRMLLPRAYDVKEVSPLDLHYVIFQLFLRGTGCASILSQHWQS